MDSALSALLQTFLTEIDQCHTLEALETLRIHYLGKQGLLTQEMKKLGQLPAEERKHAGSVLNQLKETIQERITLKKHHLQEEALLQKLEQERLDITLPAREASLGKTHPIYRAIEEAVAILREMGFSVAEGPNIEDDFHNFTALNIPDHHPARQMHDTFYLNSPPDQPPLLLRTHTSPVQIRTMQQGKPPFRIIAPGRTYRCDSDATHSPMFHQIEGLLIDKEIHFGHLKGCLIHFIERFFERKVQIRFRPSFFPFTEPSAEVDIACTKRNGELIVGEGEEWLEVLGCGMVHPNVLAHVSIDAKTYQGFAFGLGVERLAMLKYGIPDLRTFFESDVRWLRHFGFSAFNHINP